MAVEHLETPRPTNPPPKMLIALAIIALLIAGTVASVYMVRMPGSFASMLGSMLTF